MPILCYYITTQKIKQYFTDSENITTLIIIPYFLPAKKHREEISAKK